MVSVTCLHVDGSHQHWTPKKVIIFTAPYILLNSFFANWSCKAMQVYKYNLCTSYNRRWVVSNFWQFRRNTRARMIENGLPRGDAPQGEVSPRGSRFSRACYVFRWNRRNKSVYFAGIAKIRDYSQSKVTMHYQNLADNQPCMHAIATALNWRSVAFNWWIIH